MEAICSSETSVTVYNKTTKQQNPDDQCHRNDNIKLGSFIGTYSLWCPNTPMFYEK